MTTFEIGAKVWFISKYGDRVTGTYKGQREIPAGPSGVATGHIVESFDAFGVRSDTPTTCIVLSDKLYRD